MQVSQSWQRLLQEFFSTTTGKTLQNQLAGADLAGKTIFPPVSLRFRALEKTPLEQVRVVILGQDPYHGPGQADGFAFSVTSKTKVPPSLRNILQELRRENLHHGIEKKLSLAYQENISVLEHWAIQGVLLLNTCLTVEKAKPFSHCNWSWQVLTDKIISTVAALPRPIVFMLWGTQAQKKQSLILDQGSNVEEKHWILCANHPSPLSARRPPNPFIGCGHFRKANQFLEKTGQRLIKW
jgi:uracil-DNA glycosylase